MSQMGHLQVVVIASVCISSACNSRRNEPAQTETQQSVPETIVTPTEDFNVTGDGSATSWESTEWVPLHRRGEGGLEYDTRVKLLYSPTGLYVLMDGSDSRITATMTADFLDLWNEDVFEIFLWQVGS